MASPAAFKPAVPSLGSQHAFPGSLSSSTHLALVTSDKFSNKWRVCSSVGLNRLVLSGKGSPIRNLVYVDDEAPSDDTETLNTFQESPDPPSATSPPSVELESPEVPSTITADIPEASSLSPSTEVDIVPDVSSLSPSTEVDIVPDVSSLSPSTEVDIPDVSSSSSEALDSGVLTPEPQPEFSPLESTQDTFSAATNDAAASLKSATDSVTSTFTEAQESVTGFFTAIKEKVTGSITDAENSVKQSYDDVNGSILRVFKGTTGEETVSSPGIDLTSPFRTGTPANDALKEAVVIVKDGAGALLAAVGHSVSEGYFYLKSAAPSELQTSLDVTEKKVGELLTPLSSAFEQAVESVGSVERALGVDPENPIIPIVLVGGGTFYLGVLYWQSKYGGYAGDISATEVLELLNKEGNVALVDIRPQDLKDRDGIPDVRRLGRFKVASIDPLEVERPARNLLRNADEINDLITASLIRNLKNVKSNTKVVVMDADGTKSKGIAKALRKNGVYKAYRLEGGFTAWTSSGLRQKTDGEETPLSILKEETEAVVDELKPAGVLAVALATVTASFALYEWEKTLQFIGVIAVFQLIYQRLESYQSAEDFKADLRKLQEPFRLLGSLIGQPKPRLELATSPSTTAVQDRVVQAAAKHGLSPAEQQRQTEAPEADAEEPVSAEPPTLQVDEGSV